MAEEDSASGPDQGQPQQRLDFGECLDGLYGYAMVLSRNSKEAEDLVQETCLRAARAIRGLRPDSNIKSWLFTILRNIWLNLSRQSRTAPDLAELDADENGANELADAAQDPYSEYLNGVEREQVRSAMQQLPLEFREIIILREYEEFFLSGDCSAARLTSGYSQVAAGKSALQTPRLAFGPDDSFLVRPPLVKKGYRARLINVVPRRSRELLMLAKRCNNVKRTKEPRENIGRIEFSGTTVSSSGQ